MPSRSQQSGAEKTLVAKDEFYVALETNTLLAAVSPNSERYELRQLQFSKQRIAKLDAIAETLTEYPSCCPSRVLDATTVIAKQAGIDLRTHTSEHGSLTMAAFKPALRDLDKMHQNKIYLRDIKPENLTIDAKGKIFFIDTDEAAIPTLGNYSQPRMALQSENEPKYTTAMLTYKLLENRCSGNYQALQEADNYSMLLTLMEMTTTDDKLKAIAAKTKMPYSTLMNDFNRNNIEWWVEQHIKSGHVARVKDSLNDPTKNPLKVPLSQCCRF